MGKPAVGGLLFVSAIIVLFEKALTNFLWASGLVLVWTSTPNEVRELAYAHGFRSFKSVRRARY